MKHLFKYDGILIFFSSLVITSCGGSPSDKELTTHQKNDSLKTTVAIKELGVLDTVEVLGTDLKPGKYIFKSPKGGYFKFTFSAEDDNTKSFGTSESASISEQALSNPACDGPDFDASYRAKVKYTPSRSPLELKVNPNTLLDYFVSTHEDMCEHKRDLEKDKRLDIENRNVQLKKVYIYTFKRQGDEDYHVIFGTTDDISTAKFFNCEISGLSPSGTYGRDKLIDARDSFESYFGIMDKCATSYYRNDFREQPVPVLLEGSLFYDGEHCDHYENNGPQKWKELEVSIAWELHPITKIEFLE